MSKRLKPKLKEKYWYIRMHYAGFYWIDSHLWHDDDESCKRLHRNGNCFRTKKEAAEKLKQIKKILKERE